MLDDGNDEYTDEGNYVSSSSSTTTPLPPLDSLQTPNSFGLSFIDYPSFSPADSASFATPPAPKRAAVSDEAFAESVQVVNELNEKMTEAYANYEKVMLYVTQECAKLRAAVDNMEAELSRTLGAHYNEECGRLAALANAIQTEACGPESTGAMLPSLVNSARAELMVGSAYSLVKPKRDMKLTNYKLEISKAVSALCFRPRNVRVVSVSHGRVAAAWDPVPQEQMAVLTEYKMAEGLQYRAEIYATDGTRDIKMCDFTTRENSFDRTVATEAFPCESTFRLHVRAETGENGPAGDWSDFTDFTVPAWAAWCTLKKCPDTVEKNRRYDISGNTLRVATKIPNGNGWCTVIGTNPVPAAATVSWRVQVLASQSNNGCCIYIGAAPADIDQNVNENSSKCGWYYYCHDSTLFSGPPHSYCFVGYGPRKKNGEYVHNGSVVGVSLDTKTGSMKFLLDEVDLGKAFEGIPLDKPLVPSIILWHENDSVALLLGMTETTNNK